MDLLPLDDPLWDRLRSLDVLQDRAPSLGTEVAGELLDRLNARLGAARGALLLRDRRGRHRFLAGRDREGADLEASAFDQLERLDALRPGDGARLRFQRGRVIAVPLRSVFREGPPPGIRRRRFDADCSERVLGYALIQGEGLPDLPEETSLHVVSALGAILTASTREGPAGGSPGPDARHDVLLRWILREEIAEAGRAGVPLTVALVDAGGGDADSREGDGGLPARVVPALRAALRRTDTVLRCGRRGMAVLLPATDAEGGRVALEKLEGAAREREGGTLLRLGHASFPDHAATEEELLFRAGQALQSARSAGGGAVRVAWSPDLRGVPAIPPGDAAGPALVEHEALQRASDGLELVAEGLASESPAEAFLRTVLLVSGAGRAALLMPEDAGIARVAVLGGDWSPPHDLIHRAVASGGRPEFQEGGDTGRDLVAWGIRGRSGIMGILALESAGARFEPASRRLAGALASLAGPILCDRVSPGAFIEPADSSPFPGIVGDSPAMRDVYARMRKVLASTVTVLVIGETGTGKEIVSRAIHKHSDRADGPFVTVDCGALPTNLADSELFGHVKGAFTDAGADRMGLVERANGGTLFLDEVTSMPPDLQTRFLRVLQEGDIRRVGDTEYRHVDVRVIAASNHDPYREVELGTLRLDLYHRLRGMEIRIPPLRERKEDIPALAAWFLRRTASGSGGPGPKRIGPQALERLVAHHWPGNVRELENAVRAGALVAEGDSVGAEDLPEQVISLQGASTERTLPRTNEEFKQAKDEAVAEITRRFLRGILVRTGGNVSDAARETGLQRTYLHRLMKEYGVDAREFKGSAS